MGLNEPQFREAVTIHGPALRRSLLYLTRGRAEDADDLLQRTFECAWMRRDQFEGGSLSAWLQRIARFVHMTHQRSEARSIRLKNAVRELSAALPAETTAPPEQDALEHCLARLSNLDRRVLNLFYGREKRGREAPRPHTDAEIARILRDEEGGEPRRPDTIRKRRTRALGRLARCIDTLESESPLVEGYQDMTRPSSLISRMRLADFREAPDEPAFRDIREAIGRDESLRHAISRLLLAEDALMNPLWEEAWRDAGREPMQALDPALEARLLKIPEMSPSGERIEVRATNAASGPLAERLDPVPPLESRSANEPRRRSAWGAPRLMRRFAGGVALAALLFVGLRIWLVKDEQGLRSMRDDPFDATVDDPSDDSIGVRGGHARGSATMASTPIELRMRKSSGDRVINAPLTPAGTDTWRTSAPMSALVQVWALRPDRVEPLEDWTVWATMARRTASGDVVELHMPKLEGRAESTTPSVSIGPAIMLSELEGLGFHAGDTLLLTIHRGEDVFRLEIELTP